MTKVSHSRSRIPLGTVLHQAGLVSSEQVKEALEQQAQNGIKVGKILATQGRIDSKTIDFFAEQWSKSLQENKKKPIGHYFKQAALLDEWQIRIILEEQKTSQRKFGELAIAKGWLKKKTVDFFLRCLKDIKSEELSEEGPEILFPEYLNDSAQKTDPGKEMQLSKKLPPQQFNTIDRQLDDPQRVHEEFLQIKRKLLNIKDGDAPSRKTLSRVLYWTGGQPRLTQDLFGLASSHRTVLDSLKEKEQVDYLVQSKVLSKNRSNSFAQHFTRIENRLLSNRQFSPEALLELYQKVLIQPVATTESPLQQELLNIGLVVRKKEKLVIANPIYKSIFSLGWVTQKLNQQAREDKNWQNQTNSFVSVPVSRDTQPTYKSRSRGKNLLLILTLIGLLAVFINNISKRMKVRLAFKEGNQLLKQRSFEDAINSYNKLLKIDSNYYQAWTNRGYALAGLQRYKEMRESCSTATIIDPGAIYAWNCQGEALHNLKQFPEAINAFDQAIRLDKTDPIFFINKSESLSSLGRHDDSIQVVAEGIKLLEKVEAIKGKDAVKGEFAVALTFLGNGYRHQKEYLKTLKAYERAIDYSPQYFPAQIGKAITLIKVQRYQQAQKEFRKILLTDAALSDSQKVQTWFYLGKAYCKSGEFALGKDAFESALKIQPDYETAKTAKQYCR